MSIPLERMYHYLRSMHSSDTIIYQFLPHGYKNLDNLEIVHSQAKNNFEWQTTPRLIYHDQEPLIYDYYQHDDLNTCARNTLIPQLKYRLPEVQDLLIKMATDMHLRAKFSYQYHAWDSVLLCHSEKNSQELDNYERNGYIGVYWWSHAAIARDWFRYAKYDLELHTEFDNIKKDFLIYNRAWTGTREYRLKFSELLIEHELLKHCDTKFAPLDGDCHYTQHQFKNPALSIKRQDLEKFYAINNSPPTSSADYDSKEYNQCGIEIVLETVFDDQRNHLTEKTLRAIACGKPFLLVSTPGSLEYLKSYGFQTFNGLIDESYDTIQNSSERLTAVVKEMQRLANLPTSQKKQLWQKLYQIAEHNRELFFSESWIKQIFSEYQQNFEHAVVQLSEQNQGKHFQKVITLDTIEKMNHAGMPNSMQQQITTNRQQVMDWLNKHFLHKY